MSIRKFILWKLPPDYPADSVFRISRAEDGFSGDGKPSDWSKIVVLTDWDVWHMQNNCMESIFFLDGRSPIVLKKIQWDTEQWQQSAHSFLAIGIFALDCTRVPCSAIGIWQRPWVLIPMAFFIFVLTQRRNNEKHSAYFVDGKLENSGAGW